MRGPITSSVLRFSKGQPLCASLRAKGYVLSRDIGRYEEDDGPFGYLAQKNGFTFAADNPIELLELTSAYEYVRPAADEPYWWLVTGPNVADEILEASLERSLAERREREPERWRRTVQQALADAEPGCSAAEILGISQPELERLLADPLLREPGPAT